jgi:polyphosphate kinase 2 (PPK2 family)
LRITVADSEQQTACERRGRPQEFIAPFRVPAATEVLLDEGIRLLAEYQTRIAAQDTWGLLVVFQAIDAGGKNGTIRHVMSGVNPQGVRVHSFKVPSADELGHDFLWRYSRGLPARGEIGIFNRSHYAEVLVVRVHTENLDREHLTEAAGQQDEWRRRYRAFSDMLSHTSTDWAPWYVIPADRKWFCRLGAGAVIVAALMEIDPRFPRVSDAQREALLDARRMLEAEDPDGDEQAGAEEASGRNSSLAD